MKIKINTKLNIDFDKAIAELQEQKLNKNLNLKISPKVAKESSDYIKSGKVEPKLNPLTLQQRKKHFGVNHDKPLLMTGKLANSLSGSEKGVSIGRNSRGSVPYSAHRKGYTWRKDDQPTNPNYRRIKDRDVNVPYKSGPHGYKREFLITNIPSEKVKLDRIYKEFNESLVKLLISKLQRK
jgi:hypothetical protein